MLLKIRWWLPLHTDMYNTNCPPQPREFGLWPQKTRPDTRLPHSRASAFEVTWSFGQEPRVQRPQNKDRQTDWWMDSRTDGQSGAWSRVARDKKKKQFIIFFFLTIFSLIRQLNNDKDKLKNAIKKVKFIGKGTYTAKGMNKAREEFDKLDRKDAKKVNEENHSLGAFLVRHNRILKGPLGRSLC